MKFHPLDMADSVIHKLRNNSELVKIVILPAVIFFFDIFMRLVLNIDIIHAGADMALLGVSIFIALIIEDSQKDDLPALILFVFILVIMWICCLLIVSLDKQQLYLTYFSLDFRGFVCLFLGCVTFIFSSIFADSFIRNSRPKN